MAKSDTIIIDLRTESESDVVTAVSTKLPTQVQSNASKLKRKMKHSSHRNMCKKNSSGVECSRASDGDGAFSIGHDKLFSKLDKLFPTGTPLLPDFNDLSVSAVEKHVSYFVDSFLGMHNSFDYVVNKCNETQAELAVAKEKISVLEAAANEGKNTIEKLIIENEGHTKALKLSKVEGQDARAQLNDAEKKINMLEAASEQDKKTIERLITESQDQTKALKVANDELQVARAELTKAKEKNHILNSVANDEKNITKRIRAENHDHKKALHLANIELELLRKMVAPSIPISVQPSSDTEHLNANGNEASGADSHEAEMRMSQGTLRDSYYKCVEENSQLKMEVKTQKIKLEWGDDYQKKLINEKDELMMKLYKKEGDLLLSGKELKEKTDDMQDMMTKLYVMEENLNMLSKEIEDKTDEIQAMVYVNQVLIVKERTTNDELQGAYTELNNGLRDVLGFHSVIGFKLMGELNLKPFRDVCMQKFSSNECDMKSAELCSLWQENIKNQEWYPFKRIPIHGKFEEVIDENDERLMQLKDAWGEEVHKAVCVALLEINEYNPSTRCVIPAIWNLKENRKAHLKEVIAYLLKRLKVKKTKHRG